MRLALVGAVVLATSIVWAQDAQPTVKECRAELKEWVPMFTAAYADPVCTGDGTTSCPFAPPVRALCVGQLTDIAFRAEACVNVDARRRYYYQRVAARAENITVLRTVYFLKAENQLEKYAEWEQSQQQTAKPDSDEPPSTANNRLFLTAPFFGPLTVFDIKQ